ncbi:MAG: hypothetical protein ACRDY5_05290 [Acidimicrobiales bacterium]
MWPVASICCARREELVMAGRIGGNVSDIQAAAAVMTETGGAATAASSEAATLAAQMEGGIGEVTNTLSAHFTQTADTLRQQIVAARNRLGQADWEGTSRGEAEAAEAALNSQVDQVLGRALESATEFRTFMAARANEFVAMVSGDFKTIMGNVDLAYQDLAQASKTFAENLAAADQSIKFGR